MTKIADALDTIGMLRSRLRAIADIIEAVDHRAMAADGPVTPTRDEITADELKQIYRLANGRAAYRGPR